MLPFSNLPPGCSSPLPLPTVLQSCHLQGCSASHQGQSLLQPLGQWPQNLKCHSPSLCDPLSPFLLSSTKELWYYLDLSVSSRFKFWVCFFFIIQSSVTAFEPHCPKQWQEHRCFIGKCVGWNVWALPTYCRQLLPNRSNWKFPHPHLKPKSGQRKPAI